MMKQSGILLADKTTKILLTTLALGLLISSANGDVSKGQKLYSKKLKKACEISGAKMASKHTQDQWETIQTNGKLKDKIKTICPKVENINDKFLPHLYDFFYEYASDSGNVPSC